MYQLKLSNEDYKNFRKKVRHELVERDWNLVDLAKQTKYSPNTIRQFMSEYAENSRFVAFAIAEVFGWEIDK